MPRFQKQLEESNKVERLEKSERLNASMKDEVQFSENKNEIS